MSQLPITAESYSLMGSFMAVSPRMVSSGSKLRREGDL